MKQINPSDSVSLLQQGGVIAYPTEAVYGLGCDPDNAAAVEKILAIKQRPWQKGLILVAANTEQLHDFVDFSQLSQQQLAFVTSHWPGPFTFIMPTLPSTSTLLRGEFNSIAVRISAHRVVQELCLALGKPLVSTSANLAGEPPVVLATDIVEQFNGKVDALIVGELGGSEQPSTIMDAITGRVLRQG
ncbi:L-threonylcarbamoyladenylate synthase [Shewanella sp. NIFS-20-20]|uniref:L-threonylcarbamoyladenylate synthase n=1 Tax=Shewanella sp. NIFS-20-20 TaxID=2853806 RepID=UPI001C480F1D|nr:L-threonylcarbamoyladenylate synthase [Shewanella sp. NIFS-20-20]MBV7315558.1 threonylcarbamoyl-AMP synthase [Shewanella sp. NIFS-20-20]